MAPNWFASVMGTGIVANAALLLPHRSEALHDAAFGVWVVAVTRTSATSPRRDPRARRRVRTPAALRRGRTVTVLPAGSDSGEKLSATEGRREPERGLSLTTTAALQGRSQLTRSGNWRMPRMFVVREGVTVTSGGGGAGWL